MSAAPADKVRSVLDPVLTAAGFVLEDVAVRSAGSRRLVQVLVDRDRGISLDDVAEASRTVSEVLDAADVFAGAYVLEVSSPGVDRPLTVARHWQRNLGRLVNVTPMQGPDWTGRVTEADETRAVLDVNGNPRTATYADVRRAVVQVEFSRAAADSALDEDGGDG
ncbi:MAG TPA: ribosome maturation factor RimP [Mycobacteriales bacterium]|nr:ribosome maturation factor RimP [Mycobacteriales bacterium]